MNPTLEGSVILVVTILVLLSGIRWPSGSARSR